MKLFKRLAGVSRNERSATDFLGSLGVRPALAPQYELSFSGLTADVALEEGLRILQDVAAAPTSMRQSLLDRSATYFRHALALDPGLEEAHRQLGMALFTKELMEARDSGCQPAGLPFLNVTQSRRSASVGVLLIHDFGAKPAQMQDLGHRLNDLGMWTYGLRLPGHGRSHTMLEHSQPVEWFAAVERAYWVLNELTGQVVVAGQGIGAVLALLLAAQVRQVAGVVSMSAPVRVKARWVKLLPLLDPLVAYRFQKLYHEHAEVYHRYIPVRAITGMRELIRDYPRSLHRVTCPLLLLHSHRDDFSNPRTSPAIIAATVNSPICRVRYVGEKYVLAEKNPDQDQTNLLVSDFITEITGFRRPV